MQESTLFDAFFVTDDGEDVEIESRGQKATIRFRSRLSVADREEAQAKAVKKHVDMRTGQVIIDGIDEVKLTGEILSRCILKWPFDLPITPTNVMKLDGRVADQLVNRIKQQAEVDEASLDPFDAASAKA